MGKPSKRRHQSSSVEEVSPAIVKRKSTRLTRSKKVKAEAASPILIRSPVSTRQQDVAGSSRTRNAHQGRLSRPRKSHVHSLLGMQNSSLNLKHFLLKCNTTVYATIPERIFTERVASSVLNAV